MTSLHARAAALLAAADKYKRYGMGIAYIDDGWEAICDAGNLIRELLTENAELESEAEEGDALRQKMSKMLDDTANALRGQPQELHRWSWHDLPERAAAAIAAIDVMTRAARENAAEVERLRARVAELEASAPRVAILHPEPFPTLVADAGPTEFRGRKTRRQE